MGEGMYGTVQAGRLRVKASGKVKRVAVKIPHIYRDDPRPIINRQAVRRMEAAARRLHEAGLNIPKVGFMEHDVGGRRLWVQVTPLFGSSARMDYHGLENTPKDVERRGRRIAGSRLDSANAVRREPLAGKEARTFLRAERVKAQRDWRSAYRGRTRFFRPNKLPAESAANTGWRTSTPNWQGITRSPQAWGTCFNPTQSNTWRAAAGCIPSSWTLILPICCPATAGRGKR